ncbi:MAG TPA: ubiquinol-cytochrome c reductase iron-sulfur subunit [Actinomycetes bacterium]|nr:ubiquinol-cytochrome c reductase iron-sulfur subunit [Actinomycetes bacterium]
MKLNRRDLLRRGWKLGGTLLGVSLGWTAYEALRPLAGVAGGGRITLGSPANFQPESATYFNEGRLWLVNASGHFLALSQRCPHLGCRVPFCETSGRFECPCHGSVFDIGGEYVQGPAPRGMDRFQLRLDNGVLVVDTGTLITGPDRGKQDFLTPPLGPPCITRS